jgi:hypothetical protein
MRASVLIGRAGQQLALAVGDTGLLLSSEDGQLWTSRTSGLTQDIYGAATNGPTWVAVANQGRIISSADLVTWTVRYSVGADPIRAVVWTGSQFVAVGTNTILTSPDGIAWTSQTGGSGFVLLAIGSGPAGLLSAAGSNPSVASLYSTNGGVAWSTTTIPTAAQPILAIEWISNKFVAVGGQGKVFTSPDAITWTSRTSGVATDLRGLHWDDETALVVAVGDAGVVLTSPDGVAWTPKTSGIATNLNAVTFDGQVYILAGAGGVVLTSPDLVAFTAESSGTGSRINGIAP